MPFLRFPLLIILLSASSLAFSQDKDTLSISNDEIVINNVISDLFDGMRKGDTTMVTPLFHEDSRLMTTFTNREGKPMMITEDVDPFFTAIGTPHEEIWDERVSNIQITIDDNLAQVWMDYHFYVDDTFSHCGVNAFQLFKGENGWKIIQLIDTRRKTPCNQ